MKPRSMWSFFKRSSHYATVVLGAVTLTAAFFLVLPILQVINKPPTSDLSYQTIDTVLEPPPPPPPEQEPEEEPEPEEQPPELTEEAPPLDLSQLELALNPGFGSGWGFEGDFSMALNTGASDKADLDALFSLSDLDQKPRAVYQPSPVMNSRVRSKAPGTVYIIFVVDESGRVQEPQIQKASDPVFERPALAAVKQWKFEPGRRNGEAVRFRMRVPITFPKGS